jgi:hypothetical protein
MATVARATAVKRYLNSRKGIITKLLAHARERARKRGVVCSIAAEDIASVWPDDNRCPVLGLPLARSVGKSGPGDASPSLDRLDSSKGYVPGNITVVSALANQIKSRATAEQVKAVFEWMQKLHA